MPQSKRSKPQPAQPLKVRVVYAAPSREGDAAWLRALEILLETEGAKKAK